MAKAQMDGFGIGDITVEYLTGVRLIDCFSLENAALSTAVDNGQNYAVDTTSGSGPLVLLPDSGRSKENQLGLLLRMSNEFADLAGALLRFAGRVLLFGFFDFRQVPFRAFSDDFMRIR